MVDQNSLRELYQDLILEHAESPRCSGELPDAAIKLTKENSLCGDLLNVSARLAEGNLKIRFTGAGCSISQAACSMLFEACDGKPLAEVEGVAANFRKLVHGEANALSETGDLPALAGISKVPARHRCALLAVEALGEVVKKLRV